MLVGFSKLALEDELDDLMVELPAAVCDYVRWGWNSKSLDICICEVVRQLRAQRLDVLI